MSEKIYRVQMNSKGMPNFSTAVEIADRPQGEWIKDDDWCKCSVCGNTFDELTDFCPSCGARMKGVDDE